MLGVLGFFFSLNGMVLSLITKHALILLNYLFVNMFLNQNEDLYLYHHLSFELVPLEFLESMLSYSSLMILQLKDQICKKSELSVAKSAIMHFSDIAS